MEQRQYDKALFWFRSALSLNENAEKGGFVNTDSHGFLPAIGLCVCYDALGDYESAENITKSQADIALLLLHIFTIRNILSKKRVTDDSRHEYNDLDTLCILYDDRVGKIYDLLQRNGYKFFL